MKNEANLTINFCTYSNKPLFHKFVLDGENFDVKDGMSIKKKYILNKYELHLGKKYCKYILIRNDKGDDLDGSFEISSGNHIVYCFLDAPGTTFKILFLQKKEKMNDFIKSKFSSFNIFYTNKEIELSLNQNETEDRASLILINCLPYTEIKKKRKIINKFI